MSATKSPEVYHDGRNGLMYANSRVEDLPCFHAGMTRNKAELLLINLEEGKYLIRPSSKAVEGNYSVSVRVANSVRHFELYYNNHLQYYVFGHAHFWTINDLWEHLQSSTPVLECDEGVVARLVHPYYNETCQKMPEGQYSTITRHIAEPRSSWPTPVIDLVTSKEGFLFKKKKGKNWKRRWFVLNKNNLIYQKTEYEKRPLQRLDLTTAIRVEEHPPSSSKTNCFRVDFDHASYILSANSEEEMHHWINLISCQIENGHKRCST